MNMTDKEREWVAHTLTRSGTFTKNRIHRGGKVYTYPRLDFYSKEEEVVDRLLAATGVGKKNLRKWREGRVPYPLHRWSVNRQDEVRDLAVEILPLVPEARREAILEVL